MVDNNSGKDDTSKAKDSDKAGTFSDNLLRLVEEQDKDGNLSYCVECCKTGDLLYSSNSKPQAFSFAEGYRARDNSDDTSKTPKAKADDKGAGDKGAGDKGDDKASKPAQNVDPAKVQRQRKVV
jgi:hypothetical protein